MEQIIKLKETTNLILEQVDPQIFGNLHYRISIKYPAEIVPVFNITSKLDSLTVLACVGTNMQDCITSWPLYTESVMLIDEAFERCDLAKASVTAD